MLVSARPAMRSSCFCRRRASPSRPTCSFATVTLSSAYDNTSFNACAWQTSSFGSIGLKYIMQDC